MYLKYGAKCCTFGEKYKFELKNLSYKMTRAKVEMQQPGHHYIKYYMKNSNRNA